MSPLKVGETFPPAKFRYVPYTPENSDIGACGTIQELDAQKVTPHCNSFVFIILGVQRKESCFVCCPRCIYTNLSNPTPPWLR